MQGGRCGCHVPELTRWAFSSVANMTGRVAEEQSILRRAVPKTTRTTFVEPLNAARIEDKIEERMNKYHFSLVVSDPVELTESVADALYSAGCDDATPGMCEGVLTLDFHRDATSLEEAIRTAIENVRRAGLRTTRVEIDATVVGPAA